MSDDCKEELFDRLVELNNDLSRIVKLQSSVINDLLVILSQHLLSEDMDSIVKKINDIALIRHEIGDFL